MSRISPAIPWADKATILETRLQPFASESGTFRQRANEISTD
jgi:hypothetical protein